MSGISKTLMDSDILSNSNHPGCEFRIGELGHILLVTNSDVSDLVNQAENLKFHGYEISGGIQLIRRDDGSYNGSATFLKQKS